MGARDDATDSRGRRDLAELVLPVAFFQAWVWLAPYPRPRVGDATVGLALVAFIVWSARARGPSGRRAFGLGRGTHRASLAPILVPSIVLGAIALAVGALTGHLRLHADLLLALVTYPLSGAAQQAIVFGYLHPRAERLVGAARAPALTAAVFALAHAPNPLLMFGSALIVLLYAPVWRRSPSLPVQAVGHGIVGAVVSKGLTVSMRVGKGYLSA